MRGSCSHELNLVRRSSDLLLAATQNLALDGNAFSIGPQATPREVMAFGGHELCGRADD